MVEERQKLTLSMMVDCLKGSESQVTQVVVRGSNLAAGSEYKCRFGGATVNASFHSADGTVRIWAAKDAVRDITDPSEDDQEQEADPDQQQESLELAVYATKSTPVYCVQFSFQNLLHVAGVFSPSD